MNYFPQNYFILSPFQNNNYHIQRRCFPQGIFFVGIRPPFYDNLSKNCPHPYLMIFILLYRQFLNETICICSAFSYQVWTAVGGNKREQLHAAAIQVSKRCIQPLYSLPRQRRYYTLTDTSYSDCLAYIVVSCLYERYPTNYFIFSPLQNNTYHIQLQVLLPRHLFCRSIERIVISFF